MACSFYLFLRLLMLVVFLLSNNARAADVEGFWNIDCGSAQSFDDPTTNFTWVGDDELVYTGESHKVAVTASLSRELTTLRAFPLPWPRKNCYPFDFSDDGPQILVRAYFYYGNYDGRGNPPRFLIQFDGNPWRTVVTTMDSVVTHEIIYVTTGKRASICVARTDPEQHPFMSAIEVRTLTSDMYGGVDIYHAIYPMRFVAFGANRAFRYPDDQYDRIWSPTSKEKDGYSYKFVANNATFVNTSTDPDLSPDRVFRNAAEPLGRTGSNLTVTFAYLPAGSKSFYIVWYFTEVVLPAPSYGEREFSVCFEGNCFDNANPVHPKLGVVDGQYLTDSSVHTFVIDLVPNTSAKLPPIISGMAVFLVSDPMNNGTEPQDVDMMTPLKNSFPVLGNWTGDPCFPQGFNWEWIGCSVYNYSARISQLLLGGFGLSGSIPDFTPLDALVTIDLHGNGFTGSVPEFLGNFTHLTMLNIADNDFSEIPPSILSSKYLLLNYTGNPKLCKQGQICVQIPEPQPHPAPIIQNKSSSHHSNLFKLVLFSLVIAVNILL